MAALIYIPLDQQRVFAFPLYQSFSSTDVRLFQSWVLKTLSLSLLALLTFQKSTDHQWAELFLDSPVSSVYLYISLYADSTLS